MKPEQWNELIEISHTAAKEAGWWDDLPLTECFPFGSDQQSHGACPYVGPDPSGKWISGKCSFYNKDLGPFGHLDCPARNVFLQDKIDLIAGEGAEAVEALRNNRRASVERLCTDLWDNDDPEWVVLFEGDIKDTLEDEVADIAIRTLDMMGHYDLMIEGKIMLEEYEQTDEFMENDIKVLIRRIRSGALIMSACGFNGCGCVRILRACNRIAELESFDLMWHINAKMEYNKSRGRKHGKEF